MSNTIIYIRFENTLQYSQDIDSLTKFTEMVESSEIELDNGESITWKISDNPGKLERIRIKKVNKKDNRSLPGGSWKDQWTVPPKNIDDSEYYGEPNGAGATDSDPFYFAYDVDYKVSKEGWKTLDPDIRIPRSM